MTRERIRVLYAKETAIRSECVPMMRAICLTLVLFISTGATWAEESRTYVGRIIDIDGPTVKTNRMTEERWYQAYLTMGTYLHERLQTDDKTMATIAFVVGGQAVVSPDTEVEIVSRTDIQELRVKSGTIWAKFEKQEKEFQIQTSGGVLGIEGTEFFVETSADGETVVTVVEGKVRIKSDGEEQLVTDGEEATFRREGVRRFQRFAEAKRDGRDIRRLALAKMDLEDKPFGRYVARRALRKPRKTKRTRVSSAGRVQRRAAQRAVRRRLAGRFTVKGVTQPAGRPVVSWTEGRSDAQQYEVVLSEDESGDEPLWRTETRRSYASYPESGPDLTEGTTYYFTVTALDEDGEPEENSGGESLSRTTSFVADGHTAAYPVIPNSASVPGERPTFRWEPLPGAQSYQISIYGNASDEAQWVGQSDSENYTYPLSARSLTPGPRQFQIEAFDRFENKIGESPRVNFTSGEWTSEGLQGPPR